MTECVDALLDQKELTHWGQDKMATKYADNICKCLFLEENNWI